jgi:uncharacterized protein YabN with tetrapyrrole methylase and pyrophosphatase domain
VKEETIEIERETVTGDRDALEDELGDLLFAAVNLARKLDIQPGAALERANRKFVRRFRQIEALATERNVSMQSAGLEALDGLWEEVKSREL